MKTLAIGALGLWLLGSPIYADSQPKKVKSIEITNQQCYHTLDDITVISFKGQDVKLSQTKGGIMIEYGVVGSPCHPIDISSQNPSIPPYPKETYLLYFKDKPVLIVTGDILEPDYIKPYKVEVLKDSKSH